MIETPILNPLLSAPLFTPLDSDPDNLEVLEAVRKEYYIYCYDVKQYVDMVEMYFDATPSGLAYEVRAFTGHIGDAIIRTDQSLDQRIKNVEDAHSHLRRITLDCLKMIGIWQRDQVKAFDKKYRWTDLSDVNDGNFVKTYSARKKHAQECFHHAKSAERPGKNDQNSVDSENVYKLYLDMYNANTEVLKFLDDSCDAVARVAARSKRQKIINVICLILGILGPLLSYVFWVYPHS